MEYLLFSIIALSTTMYLLALIMKIIKFQKIIIKNKKKCIIIFFLIIIIIILSQVTGTTTTHMMMCSPACMFWNDKLHAS